jgi:hypothetical protein
MKKREEKIFLMGFMYVIFYIFYRILNDAFLYYLSMLFLTIFGILFVIHVYMILENVKKNTKIEK